MEQQPQPMSGRKPPLDDTVPLSAVIEASQSLQSHTVNGTIRRVSIRSIWIIKTFHIDCECAFKCQQNRINVDYDVFGRSTLLILDYLSFNVKLIAFSIKDDLFTSSLMSVVSTDWNN